MKSIRWLIATTLTLHAIVVTAQQPKDFSLLQAIGSLNYSEEPSVRQEAIHNLGATFIDEGNKATHFRQIGDIPLIDLIHFMGGHNAEIRVSFAKAACVTLLTLTNAYGVPPRREYQMVHVLDMKGGYMRGEPVWVFEFSRTEKGQRYAIAYVSKDRECVDNLWFYSRS